MMKTIALDEATYSRLVECRARLVIAASQRPDLYPPWMTEGRLSLDSVVSFLLDHRDRDSERKRRHDEKRRTRYVLTEPDEQEGAANGQ